MWKLYFYELPRIPKVKTYLQKRLHFFLFFGQRMGVKPRKWSSQSNKLFERSGSGRVGLNTCLDLYYSIPNCCLIFFTSLITFSSPMSDLQGVLRYSQDPRFIMQYLLCCITVFSVLMVDDWVWYTTCLLSPGKNVYRCIECDVISCGECGDVIIMGAGMQLFCTCLSATSWLEPGQH